MSFYLKYVDGKLRHYEVDLASHSEGIDDYYRRDRPAIVKLISETLEPSNPTVDKSMHIRCCYKLYPNPTVRFKRIDKFDTIRKAHFRKDTYDTIRKVHQYENDEVN